ncbi:MAG: LPXTG cell wall anchor domain-containing protein, partial [Oscillospiraceae bacterium]|nr:LPXTG cell wall anchor domain-containing protein [Oscillospiraceae bacterium]
GSLQTGDSTPVAAILIAGLTAAGAAIAVSCRRKEQ